ncbi:MAG: hypothetical protein G01um101456_756 [Parcubacteria group bacterium Gr01-1014_56]|nr:MAG: hypothetical protein G01um101456_756 [Parcubacteria group bacterium Gr01-1014_56]
MSKNLATSEKGSAPLLQCEGTMEGGARFIRAAEEAGAGCRAVVRFREEESTTDPLTFLTDLVGRKAIVLEDLSKKFVSNVLIKDDWSAHPNRSFTFIVLPALFMFGTRSHFIQRLAPKLEEMTLWKE